MKVLAIDPGNIFSAYALIDDYKPSEFGKIENPELESMLPSLVKDADIVIIEQIKSYGMAIGQTVIDTCVEIGRLMAKIESLDKIVNFIPRKSYITDLCCDPRAKDANVIQYLIDRFAQNVPNRGKGSKSEPGWFYGFKADVWQAYAIAVWATDHASSLNKILS